MKCIFHSKATSSRANALEMLQEFLGDTGQSYLISLFIQIFLVLLFAILEKIMPLHPAHMLTIHDNKM